MSIHSWLKMHLAFYSFVIKIALSIYFLIVATTVLFVLLGQHFVRVLSFPLFAPAIILLLVCGILAFYYICGKITYIITDEFLIIMWSVFRAKQAFSYQINLANVLEVKRANMIALLGLHIINISDYFTNRLVSIKIKDLSVITIAPNEPTRFIQDITLKMFDLKNKLEVRS